MIRQREKNKKGTFKPTRVCEVEITEGLRDFSGFRGYRDALVLVKSHGVPAGCVRVVPEDGVLAARDIRLAIEQDWVLGEKISREALTRWLMKHERQQPQSAVSWSVVVCTRDRADALKRCLDSLLKARRPADGEVIVVDNNPPDNATRECVSRYPVKYLIEPRQGLNWARACGVKAAQGEVVLFTDDDVVVDRLWIEQALAPFAAARVGAVAGLTMPAEIESPAQAFFEQYGGHSRGFCRRVFDMTTFTPAAAGQIGSGANMAFRRRLALEAGLFDNEIDVGTATLSGGDTYAFYRILAEGYQIVYTPAALVWHFHRRDGDALRRMLYGYSVGGFSVLTRILMQHRDPQALKVAFCWLKHHHIRQLRRRLLGRRDALPLDVILTEWRGVFGGSFAYFKARRKEVHR